MWPFAIFGAIKAGADIYSGVKQKEAAYANANILRQQGGYQRDAYYDQASKLNTQGQAFLGTQKSAFASANVKLDSGSPLAVMRESQKALQQDISRTRQMGDNALSLSINQARNLRKQGNDAFTSSIFGGVNSFLGSLRFK